MNRMITWGTLALVALTLSASNAEAQSRRHRHNQHQGRANHRGHQMHNQHHVHRKQHHHHGLRHHGIVKQRVNLIVHRPAVRQATAHTVAIAKFFGPGHPRFNQRFHSLVLKNRLPIRSRWNDGRYWVYHNDVWVVYDQFVQSHCDGNWDWYLSKHRSKYGF